MTLKAGEVEIVVRRSKTIQERQYEPVTVEVQVKKIVREEDYDEEVAELIEEVGDLVHSTIEEDYTG